MTVRLGPGPDVSGNPRCLSRDFSPEIALAFLQAGYRVRGTVRTQAKADGWAALSAFVPFAATGQLQVVLVPDIVKPDAFDNALDGVDYVVHTIAQLPDWRPGVQQDMERDILRPNIDGTLNALKSAAKFPAVKKVIVLGCAYCSLWALVPIYLLYYSTAPLPRR